jgi:hypothetical protein
MAITSPVINSAKDEPDGVCTPVNAEYWPYQLATKAKHTGIVSIAGVQYLSGNDCIVMSSVRSGGSVSWKERTILLGESRVQLHNPLSYAFFQTSHKSSDSSRDL